MGKAQRAHQFQTAVLGKVSRKKRLHGNEFEEFKMEKRTGRFALLEQWKADGVRYIFGNPGSVEESLLDAMTAQSDIEYVLGLQETVAVAMADGYARYTQRPAVVQLHTGVGLGNGIGMLYQARRGHSPLVVIAGDAGVKYDAMDSQMAADLVGMARPVTKYATRVMDPGSVLRVMRRAYKMAATPPAGPVFVQLPMDILDAPNDEPVTPTQIPSARVMPDEQEIDKAAQLLIGAENPVIIMGDGVARAGATQELATLAELLGAGVWGANSSEINLALSHPLFCGLTGHMFGQESARITADADAVLICGTYVFPEVFPLLTGAFNERTRIIHIDLDPYEIGKNFPADLGLVSDPKLTLAMLAERIEKTAGESRKTAFRERGKRIAAANRSALERAQEEDKRVRDQVPLHMSRFAEELARKLPADGVIFDEALTVSPELTRYVRPSQPGHYFQTRGGSLGVGIPGAMGIKLACPDKKVVALAGDGAAMYTIQALWTAAHHNIDAGFVICNNRSYRLLKLNLLAYWQEMGIEGTQFPPSFDISNPDLDFVRISKGLGVAAVRVENPGEVGRAIDQMLSHHGPFLLDVALTSEVGRGLIGAKCGQ